jgi:hypothetical protein
MTHAVNTDQKLLRPLHDPMNFTVVLCVTLWVLAIAVVFYLAWVLGHNKGVAESQHLYQISAKEADCIMVTTTKNDVRVPVRCLHFYVKGASK